MPFSYDPEIATALVAASAAMGEVPQPEVGDWQAVRDAVNTRMAAMRAIAPAFPTVTLTEHVTTAADGSAIALRWYSRDGAQPGSAVLYLHGGGMICGSVDLYDPVISAYVAASGVPILAVEYRLAPEHPHPIPVEDSYAGLCWLMEQASALGLDKARIGVMGDSAGGGLAAGVALLARDRGIALARQILIYPMLDDRTVVPDAALTPFATWSYANNITGWAALLGDSCGTATVPASAAPARMVDATGLAPAYIEVGELDIFRDESIAYARRLTASGISTELHVHPGVPHGFEKIAPDSNVAKTSHGRPHQGPRRTVTLDL